jgi:hypothetical protein
MSSLVDDDTADVTWPQRDKDAESCWRPCCWGDLAVTRCRYRVKLATMLPSHAGDRAAGATWPRCDVDVESCWQQCCRVMLATALPG